MAAAPSGLRRLALELGPGGKLVLFGPINRPSNGSGT